MRPTKPILKISTILIGVQECFLKKSGSFDRKLGLKIFSKISTNPHTQIFFKKFTTPEKILNYIFFKSKILDRSLEIWWKAKNIFENTGGNI